MSSISPSTATTVWLNYPTESESSSEEEEGQTSTYSARNRKVTVDFPGDHLDVNELLEKVSDAMTLLKPYLLYPLMM